MNPILSIILIVLFLVSLIILGRIKAPIAIETCSGIRHFKNQRDLESHSYILIYEDGKSFTLYSDNLSDLYHNFLMVDQIPKPPDPISIVLPNGKEMPYDFYVFHKFFDHGFADGNEKSLITLLTEFEPNLQLS